MHAVGGGPPLPGVPPPLRDLAVVPRAVLRRALWRADGLGALQAVAFAAAAPSAARQGVGTAVHHDGVHAVGHGEGFQVALDGDRERQLIDQVDRRAGDDGPTTEVLEAEDWKGVGRWGVGKGGKKKEDGLILEGVKNIV